jgi:hypothetical protein
VFAWSRSAFGRSPPVFRGPDSVCGLLLLCLGCAGETALSTKSLQLFVRRNCQDRLLRTRRWSSVLCLAACVLSIASVAEHRNDGTFERGVAGTSLDESSANGQSLSLFPREAGAPPPAGASEAPAPAMAAPPRLDFVGTVYTYAASLEPIALSPSGGVASKNSAEKPVQGANPFVPVLEPEHPTGVLLPGAIALKMPEPPKAGQNPFQLSVGTGGGGGAGGGGRAAAPGGGEEEQGGRREGQGNGGGGGGCGPGGNGGAGGRGLGGVGERGGLVAPRGSGCSADGPGDGCAPSVRQGGEPPPRARTANGGAIESIVASARATGACGSGRASCQICERSACARD